MQAKNNRVSIVVAAVPFSFSFIISFVQLLLFYLAAEKKKLHLSVLPGSSLAPFQKFKLNIKTSNP
jgi:hypothetical protein